MQNINIPFYFSAFFQNIHQGIYPYTLTITDWVFEYEEKEWNAQANDRDEEAKISIINALEKCTEIKGNIDILHGLDQANQHLMQKYSPRPTQPETWRPQNAAHWAVKWVKVLAEIHYSNLSNDWRIIASNNHAVVAGFTKENTVYLLDIMLLSTDPQEIYQKLTQQQTFPLEFDYNTANWQLLILVGHFIGTII